MELVDRSSSGSPAVHAASGTTATRSPALSSRIARASARAADGVAW
jgi:hypothetical protein